MKPIHLAIAATFIAIASPALAIDCDADMRSFTHAGGETCIPEKAERIIGLHDQSVTLTLLELGAPVVGSMGRIDDDNEFYMRSVDLIFGLDFENSEIAYVGTWDAMDFEAMTVLKPDLIIGREYDMEWRHQYEAIAPSVFIADNPTDPMATGRGFADAAGYLPEHQQMETVYQANLERARFALPQAQGATYSKIQAWDGNLEVYNGYGGLTKVLEDLGFEKTEVALDLAERGVAWGETVSPEILPRLEADYLFDTYTIAYGDTLKDPATRLNEAVPGWCDFLSACTTGRYIVLPREYATGFTFTQLNMLLQMITTNVANAPALDG